MIKRWHTPFIFLMLSFLHSTAFGQRTFATVTPSSSPDKFDFWSWSYSTYVNNDLNATNASDSSYATLFASREDAWLQLKYNQTIPKGTTSFVRITSANLTTKNLHTLISVEAYRNASNLSNGTKINTSVQLMLAQNTQETFLAITPLDEDYNSVRVIVHPSNTAHVYYSFFGNIPDCGAGWTSSYHATSSSANTPSAATTVSNHTQSVDGSVASSSAVTLGVQQKDVTIAQTIYFNTLAQPTDVIRLYLSEPAGQNRNLFKATLQAYRNSTPVGSTVNIFQLLPIGSVIIPIEVSPGIPFDRLMLSLTSGSNSSTSFTLNIHEAQLLPPTPMLSEEVVSYCEDLPSPLSINNPVSGVQYNWYADNALIQQSLASTCNPVTLSAGAHTISVTASKPGCPESSADTITLKVFKKPASLNIESIN